MAKVVYQGNIIAESNDTVVVEGNHYFPKSLLKNEIIEDSSLTTVCPWKGTAHYYHLNLDGEKLNDMVWYYPHPSEKAKSIEGRIAFYQKNGLKVLED